MRPGRRAVVVLLALGLAGCGGAAASSSTPASTGGSTPAASATTTTPAVVHRRPPPAYPRLLASAAAGRAATPFVPAVSWRGQTAAWVARTSGGVTLLSFDQRLVELHLHSGTLDAGGAGWRYGPAIHGLERRRVVAAFNGGFRLNTGAGGFEAYGRVGYALRAGLGSIVTYSDGSTDVGSWRGEVPAPGHRVVSVRQNLTLLIDHGTAAANLSCLVCWGATLGGVSDPARSALGVTADGRLIWAGGEHLTVSELVGALLDARVVRAVELDINPEWVAAYLYAHRGASAPPRAVPEVPDQQGIPGQFLSPWSRDFFSVAVR